MKSQTALRVITLNLWDLGWGLSSDREQRVKAFCEVLPGLGADLVGLQEVWVESDQKAIAGQAAAAGLGYTHAFHSGMMGSGLMILSRFPILDVAFHAFRLRSRPEKVHRGDYYAGKGIAVARLQTPFGLLDFYTLHSLAQYAPDYQDEYAGHRSAQLYEAANFINAYSQLTPLIVTGDFNVSPRHLGYRLMTKLAGLTDCYESLHPNDPSITFSLENPYNRHYREPERLDYICVRGTPTFGLHPTQAEITLKKQPEYPYLPYSDHYAVQVDLEVIVGKGNSHHAVQSEEIRQVLEEFADQIKTTLDRVVQRRNGHLIGLVVSLLAGLFLRQFSPQAGRAEKRLRGWGALLAWHGAVLHGLLAGVVVVEEVQILRAISKEVRVKIFGLQTARREAVLTPNGQP